MVKRKVVELEGAALDYAVAIAAYPKSIVSGGRLRVRDDEDAAIASVWFGERGSFTTTFSPSADWSQAGPLIERYRIRIDPGPGSDEGEIWQVEHWGDYAVSRHVSPLVAAMRVLVAGQLGDEVEIPEELA